MIRKVVYFVKSKEPVLSAALAAGITGAVVALTQGEPAAAVGVALLSGAWGYLARRSAWSPDSVNKLP